MLTSIGGRETCIDAKCDKCTFHRTELRRGNSRTPVASLRSWKPHTRQQRLPNKRKHQCRGRRRDASCRAATDQQVNNRLRVTLSPRETAAYVRFGRVPYQGDFAIVVSKVEPGSNPEREGLKAGQKLLAISSPMQSGSAGEMWSINQRPSLRFVTDAIRLNRSSTIQLELTNSSIVEGSNKVSEDMDISLLQSMEDAALQEEGKTTVADKLAEAYRDNEQTAVREKKQRERRIQRRRDYMDRESTRDNTKFFVGLAASFFLPALGILAYAFSSGLMDRIGSQYKPY